MFATSIFIDPLYGQDALNRSVQVSARYQAATGSMEFSWPWDWSEGGYTIYKKHPDSTDWGTAIGTLPWGSTNFSDPSFSDPGQYEYAFYKKEFETIVWEVTVPAGQSLVFSIENIYGNGLCCNFGHGWYLTQACGQTLSGGSDFGFSKIDTIQICDNGNPTETLTVTINPDMLTNNTWWKLRDLNGQLIDSSGVPGTNLAERPKFGYVLATTHLEAVTNRGTLLLVVDDAYEQPLADELAQLKLDLWGDGWKVRQIEVNRNEAVATVKSLIHNELQQAPDLKMVYLLGHVPVPYSGSFYADGHIESHWGAWPADVYYGDLDGAWTDETVNNTTASFPRNHNQPGDGKFDQSVMPSKVELAIGRVDLYDMTAFGTDDVELTRRYLGKSHLFKLGELQVGRRGLVDDNLGIALGAPAASGWRNFAPMFTADSVKALDYFTAMKTDSYLWSFGGGSGSFTSANGIGNTNDFVQDTLRNIFTLLCGSYFGDWDNPNNFLRAPLASPSWTLASAWAGNPPFMLHRMAVGEPIGLGLLRTQNATESDYYPGPQLVHAALMGDPSLRLHPVKPVQNLTAFATQEGVELNWEAPVGEAVAGYHVYRAATLYGELQQVNADLVVGTQFLDPFQPSDSVLYMVRAVKLETSGSGTYWNTSLGQTAWSQGAPCSGEIPSTTELFSICEGQSLVYGDSVFTMNGTYQYHHVTAEGCDSLVIIYLNVELAPILNITGTLCEGDSIVVGDTTLTSPGNYELIQYNAEGCIQHINYLLVGGQVVTTNIDSIYSPPIQVGGQDHSDAFTYTFNLTSSQGCDSFLVVHFYPASTKTEDTYLEKFRAYPNPSGGLFYFDLPSAALPLELEIWDGLGHPVYYWHYGNGSDQVVDARGLPNGVYWMKIRTASHQIWKRISVLR